MIYGEFFGSLITGRRPPRGGCHVASVARRIALHQMEYAYASSTKSQRKNPLI
jgi:hypothetical protein